MPECTKAERALIDAYTARPWSLDRWNDAIRVLNAERKRAQTAPDPRDARIAELEAELAKERERPRGVARRFVAARPLNGSGDWEVDERAWMPAGWWCFVRTISRHYGPDAERHAREHAAMLTAREEGA